MIRPFLAKDREACLAIFDSNTPPYFDTEERAPFEQWLDASAEGRLAHHSSCAEHYFVLEENNRVIACAGYYIVRSEPIARMAWGMVDVNHHKKGIGTEHLLFRLRHIQAHYPHHQIELGTSQYTYAFYERFHFVVTNRIKDGYGPGIDRIDMTYKPQEKA